MTDVFVVILSIVYQCLGLASPCSNICSKTMGPIELKFYIESPLVGRIWVFKWSWSQDKDCHHTYIDKKTLDCFFLQSQRADGQPWFVAFKNGMRFKWWSLTLTAGQICFQMHLNEENLFVNFWLTWAIAIVIIGCQLSAIRCLSTISFK